MTLNLTTAQTYYTFALYPVDTKFNRIAGIYIFLVIPPRHVELSSRACRGTTSHPPMAEVPETAAEALGTVAEALEARHPELVSGSHSESNSEPIQEKLSSLKGTGGCENIQPEINTHHPASRHPELVEGQQYSLLYIGITNFKLRFQ